MKMSGNRTYLVSLLALLAALFLLSAGGSATWGNPSGDYSAVVQRVVAAVLLAQAAGFIFLRAAISKLEQTINTMNKEKR